MSHCGTSTCDNDCDYRLIVLKDIQHSSGTECIVLDEMWSMLVGMTLVLLKWMVLCMFGLVVCSGFHWNSSLGCSILFGTEWNISITKSPRVTAEIPSMRKPASREMISASAELCETEVRFLHIQLKHQRVTPENAQNSSWCWLILSLQDLLQFQSLETIQACNVVLCFQHNNIVGTHLCDECTKSNAPSVCRKPFFILWPHEQIYSQTMKCQVSQYEPNTHIWEQFVNRLQTILPLTHFPLL